jgi:hypothetical protein
MTKQRIPKWFPNSYPSYRTLALSDYWVWCDAHSEIHKAVQNVYGMEETEPFCNHENWRAVYVETDEEDEVF